MRVTGLDPAGPLFTDPVIVSADDRLASTDANFVQVIHTNANAFGAGICLGDADFWANGGTVQPVCENLGTGLAGGGVTGNDVLVVIILRKSEYILLFNRYCQL